MNMKKTLLLTLTLVITTTALSGCDNAAQKRREACTEARNTATDSSHGRVDKDKGNEAYKTWDTLKCHQSDVITH